MKTTLTTAFATALMVFAFNATPAYAKGEESARELKCDISADGADCDIFGQVDELKDPDQANNERDVADSGDEGSTSAASAGDQ